MYIFGLVIFFFEFFFVIFFIFFVKVGCGFVSCRGNKKNGIKNGYDEIFI